MLMQDFLNQSIVHHNLRISFSIPCYIDPVFTIREQEARYLLFAKRSLSFSKHFVVVYTLVNVNI